MDSEERDIVDLPDDFIDLIQKLPNGITEIY